ncbi:capsule biosynthesis protein [Roseococcus sp. SDR]|uniref:capsule biosynthesis protein n=1 Tax=Roseococcus sp. SDR TaxID=2835532 RepID=UPI001BD12F97|nr:capsule biosynthesis protein [Roseococcus sp. SDR]MBS7790714.1 capsule biosynthesis protein [Roseococcus sp. SDR]MBV1846028.1 capsule biosynthesis protein [Roseococcus sp. SDR]
MAAPVRTSGGASALRAKTTRTLPARAPTARAGQTASLAERLSGRTLGAVPSLGGRGGWRGWMREHPFTMWVVLPSLIAAFYLFFVAAPQYVSESRFLVRAQMPRAATSSSVGSEMLGSAGFLPSPENVAAVRDFLLSHDAVRKTREKLDLVEIFRRPEADPLFRLWWAHPTAERLRWFYRWQVTVTVDPTTGISDLRVWTFRPADSLALSNRLLELSQELVNEMNNNIREEALRIARSELRRAETRLTDARVALTMFRQQEREVDPTATATAAVATINSLQSDIARARSDLQALQAFARPGSPQILVLENRIRGLEAQVAEERTRIASANTGVTEQMETFARLSAEVTLAQSQLEANVLVLDRANSDAARQTIFLSRVVDPNLAERSLFPLPYWASLYVFLSLTVLYGMTWLIVTGMREHAR